MRKNRLTLYILIALILGVIAGYIYNVFAINALTDRITHAHQALHSVDRDAAAIKDTTAPYYKTLAGRRAVLLNNIRANETLRDSKVSGFTLLSDIFLRLIKMIVAPLVFASLVVGVAKIEDIKSVGRIGGKTLLWFLGASLVSLLVGMLLVNLFAPGNALHTDALSTTTTTPVQAQHLSVTDFIDHIFPRSFAEAMANNEILQIVVFALFFGIGTAAVGEKGRIVIKFFESVTQILLKITGYVMMLAPLAVFGAIAAVVAKQGLGVLTVYAVFLGEFYFSLLILWFLIFGAGYLVLNKRILGLIGGTKDAMLLAFGTSTSEAAYPKLFEELEQFGCSNKIISFVLPLGYSFNLDGGMMYMTFAAMFIAQAFGIHLPLAQQLTMLLVLMLASKGVAGVPRAALVVVALILPQFNLPEAGFALIIGIDPLLDMGRSATNVLGNAVACAVVSKWEKELN